MGTTFARNAPIELGRSIHVEPVALRYPGLKVICAHMGHPWYEETIAVTRKQPNVYCEISALFYRPWQFWNILACAQEYRVTDKIFFGTDFRFPACGKASTDCAVSTEWSREPGCRESRTKSSKASCIRILSSTGGINGRASMTVAL
jgi:predicted TIM-barrel fold metal-dependent hydrolase